MNVGNGIGRDEIVNNQKQRSQFARRSQFIAWLPLLGIYLLFMIGNISLPTVFRMYRSGLLEIGAMFFNGTLAAELAILGAWMALDSRQLLERLLLCVFLLGSATICFVAGVTLAMPRAALSLREALFLYGLSLTCWLLWWCTMSFIRRSFGWRIQAKHAPHASDKRSQISITFMLASIAVAATLIAMARSVMPTASRGPEHLMRLILPSVVYALYTLVLFIPSFWLGMKHPIEYWVLTLLTLALFFVGILTIVLLHFTGVGTFGWLGVAWFYAYSLGFVVTVVSVFRLLRFFGMELVDEKPSAIGVR